MQYPTRDLIFRGRISPKCAFSSGSVLMEYLVILVFVGGVLAVASSTLFYGYTADANEGRRFGPMGRAIQGFYQRTMGGISLPVP